MRPVTYLLLMSGLAWAAACGSSDDSSFPFSSSSDEAEIRKMIEESGFMAMENELGSNEEMEYSKSSADYIFFWREIESRPLEIHVDISGDRMSADVTVEYTWDGIWHIYEEDLSQWRRPFHYDGLAYAHFERRHGGWRLEQLSGSKTEGEAPPVEIEWVRVQSLSGVDTTFTDPLMLMDVETGVLGFIRGEEVTVTVSGPDSSDVVLLHTPFMRRAFEYVPGEDVFVGTWTVVKPPGNRRAWVDAINADTFEGLETPDRTCAWGLPYRITE
jgi:hypothetical protein